MDKYKRKQQEIACDNCSEVYLKDISEIKRNIKLGRKNYCSRHCLGISNTNNLDGYKNLDTTHLNPSNRRDEFTPFRDFLRRVQRRNQESTVTLKELKEVWDKQKGICTYSKVKLITPTKGRNNRIFTASLDRINSSIGYTKENIQFISINMNYLKNDMSHEEMLNYLLLLKEI